MRFTIDFIIFPGFTSFSLTIYTLVICHSHEKWPIYMCFDDLPIKNNDSP